MAEGERVALDALLLAAIRLARRGLQEPGAAPRLLLLSHPPTRDYALPVVDDHGKLFVLPCTPEQAADARASAARGELPTYEVVVRRAST